jgi:hypothetical protein
VHHPVDFWGLRTHSAYLIAHPCLLTNMLDEKILIPILGRTSQTFCEGKKKTSTKT